MPYIIVTAWIPISKGGESAEKYMEVRKEFPVDRSLTKEVLQGAVKIKRDMIKSLSISEVKPGKLDEALVRQQNSMIPFHDIEGYEYKIEVFFSYPESFGMIGLKSPE